MTKVISLEKFSDELGSYMKDNIKLYKQAVIKALTDALPRLVEKSPVDTGLFAQSWHLDVNEQNAMLGNFAPHAPIIEYGARPFTPPLGPLLNWAKRVLKKSEVDDDCYALARYTQMKISEHGMKPRHILTNEIDIIVNDIRQNMKKGFVE